MTLPDKDDVVRVRNVRSVDHLPSGVSDLRAEHRRLIRWLRTHPLLDYGEPGADDRRKDWQRVNSTLIAIEERLADRDAF
jgi:hypothetical protein